MNHTPVRRRNSFKFFKKILTLGFVVAAFVIIIIWESRNYVSGLCSDAFRLIKFYFFRNIWLDNRLNCCRGVCM